MHPLASVQPKRASYNGNTLASQARAVGSIPIARSTVFQRFFSVGDHRNDGSEVTGKTFVVTAERWLSRVLFPPRPNPH